MGLREWKRCRDSLEHGTTKSLEDAASRETSEVTEVVYSAIVLAFTKYFPSLCFATESGRVERLYRRGDQLTEE